MYIEMSVENTFTEMDWVHAGGDDEECCYECLPICSTIRTLIKNRRSSLYCDPYVSPFSYNLMCTVCDDKNGA
jgi:hypothetical protein